MEPAFFVQKTENLPFLALQSCLILLQGGIAEECTGMEKDCTWMLDLLHTKYADAILRFVRLKTLSLDEAAGHGEMSKNDWVRAKFHVHRDRVLSR